MRKNIFIILFSILAAIQANAQADCFFRYSYIGKVNLRNKAGNNGNVFIQLPAPELMVNIVDKSRGFIKAKVSDQLTYERESVTTGSSFFCGSPANVIEKILKGSNSVYTIYIIKGKRKYKRNIKIEDIEFSFKEGVIYITLPQVSI